MIKNLDKKEARPLQFIPFRMEINRSVISLQKLVEFQNTTRDDYEGDNFASEIEQQMLLPKVIRVNNRVTAFDIDEDDALCECTFEVGTRLLHPEWQKHKNRDEELSDSENPSDSVNAEQFVLGEVRAEITILLFPAIDYDGSIDELELYAREAGTIAASGRFLDFYMQALLNSGLVRGPEWDPGNITEIGYSSKLFDPDTQSESDE